MTVCRVVQRSCFEREHQELSRGKSISRSSVLHKLDVYLDRDNVIHVGGKLRNSDLSDDVKHPLILPADDEIFWAMIHHFHQKEPHQG